MPNTPLPARPVLPLMFSGLPPSTWYGPCMKLLLLTTFSQRLFHLMASPVDRIVQGVPLWIEFIPQLWVSPLFLKNEPVRQILMGSTYPLYKGCSEILRGIVSPFHRPWDFFLRDWQPCHLHDETVVTRKGEMEEDKNVKKT